MKVKINIEKHIDFNPDNKIELNDEIDVEDSLFDQITKPLVNKNNKKKYMWYATLDGKLILNYKGKHTYTSEKKLYNGIIANFEQLFRLYKVPRLVYDSLTIVKFDFNELLDRLLKEKRIVFHKLEYDLVD